MDSRDIIRQFILDNVAVSEIGDDVDLFDAGLVRSMFVMQLVVFVEQEFGIAVTGADLDFAHFRSVERIDDLVKRKVTTV
ncbi:acyl carrier protein [Nocardia panacis]|uniref:Acyl carrier protein n=1 Tax=Nocardia panacis TaxID=2340916 RepID=A0A3A4K840_9NOCA|nr:phosphopantetheine-binding protein [Nocardia panacis]RJO70847.1 acyl carrier protein [Nocardia panacis]